MAEYTYANIIMDPNDPRLEGAIGKDCYFNDNPKMILEQANNNSPDYLFRLKEVNENDAYPFTDEEHEYDWALIIIKKEEQKKYVPFESAQEFLDEYYKSETGRINDGLEHYLSTRGLWLWDKNDEAYKMISEIWNGGVIIGDMKVWTALANQASPTFNNIKTWKKLTEEYEFLDRSPCGKKINNK